MSGDKHFKIQSVLLVDVAPLSLGIETAGGVITEIVERNAKIPCTHTQTFTTYSDNQAAVTVQVYEGERAMSKDNNLLGTFDLTGIPPAPRGVPQVDVSFDLDLNGILNVTAKENSTGKTKNIVIKYDKRILSQADIEIMFSEAEKFREEDNVQRETVRVRCKLEMHIYKVKQTLDDVGSRLSDSECSLAKRKCEETLRWLDSNSLAKKDEYEKKLKEMKNAWAPLLKKLHDTRPRTPGTWYRAINDGPVIEEAE